MFIVLINPNWLSYLLQNPSKPAFNDSAKILSTASWQPNARIFISGLCSLRNFRSEQPAKPSFESCKSKIKRSGFVSRAKSIASSILVVRPTTLNPKKDSVPANASKNILFDSAISAVLDMNCVRFENLIPDIRYRPIPTKTCKHFATDWIRVVDSIDDLKSTYNPIVESTAVTVKMW